MNAIRIFMADDHPVVIEGVRRFIEGSDGFVLVGSSQDASAVPNALQEHEVHVLVLDLQMPGGDPARTIRAALKLGIPTVLFSLRRESDELVQHALGAGAAAFVSKGASMDALLDTVREIVRRSAPPSPRDSAPPPPHASLTRREYEVFERLARCMSLQEAAFDIGISSSTAYTHASRVRNKLGVSSFAEVVQYAERWNVVFDE